MSNSSFSRSLETNLSARLFTFSTCDLTHKVQSVDSKWSRRVSRYLLFFTGVFSSSSSACLLADLLTGARRRGCRLVTQLQDLDRLSLADWLHNGGRQQGAFLDSLSPNRIHTGNAPATLCTTPPRLPKLRRRHKFFPQSPTGSPT